MLSSPLYFLAVWGGCVCWMWPFLICISHFFVADSDDLFQKILNDIEKIEERVANIESDLQLIVRRKLSKISREGRTIRILKELASDNAEEILVVQNQSYCTSCLSANFLKTATTFCLECGEILCDSCNYEHGSKKATEGHKPIPIQTKTHSLKDCTPCELSGKHVKAELFCGECEEFLCQDCANDHKERKAMQQHTLQKLNPSCATKVTIQLCNICKSQAMKYCTNCQMFFCAKCTYNHEIDEVTKNHILSYVSSNRRICSLCLISENKEIYAEGFCADCEDFLCSPCINRHKATKMLRNHKFLSVSEGQSRTSGGNVLICEPCKYLSKSQKAYAFCKECEELLCDLCYKQHPAQKQNRGHQLESNLSMYAEFMEQQHKNEIEKEERDRIKEETPEELEEKTPTSTDIPGKPLADGIKADSVTISWNRPGLFDKRTDCYQITYKEKDRLKWKFCPGESDRATKEITDLKADTEYIFRVRVVHQNGEGQYGEESDVIKTVISSAANLVNFSTIVKQGNPTPSVYGVQIKKVPYAWDSKNKTKKFEVGEKSRHPNVIGEKTIMLVGATGTGKSTMLDGLVNYALGVNWNDKFRFTIIDLEDEEKAKKSDESVSQTEWITVYTINHEQGGRLNYTLNIIDTPGFGDTRGLQRDQQIVEQIRALFYENGVKGVQCIDAICFLIKAPDARLTAVQRYIFQQIMALFGKDVEENICSLITFADGQDPPVLAALAATKLPFGKHFTFNNAGLFAKNTELDNAGLSPMFWDMGIKSFNNFFSHLATMQTKSLQLTKSVLDERKKLETTVQNLQPLVDAGIAKLNMLNKEIRIISQHRLEAESNKDFEYEVEEVQQRKIELPKGLYMLNCLNCHFTCHENCRHADEEKKKCPVIDSEGNCTQCPDKCTWVKHVSSRYCFEYVSIKKKRTYREKLQKYQEAEGKRLTHEQVFAKMVEGLEELREGIESLMQTVQQSNERLAEIALRPNPLSITDHIDFMIREEKLEQKTGHTERIAMLEEMKHRVLTTKRAETLLDQINQHNKNFPGRTGDDTVQMFKRGNSQDVKEIEQKEPKPSFLRDFIGKLF